jgi:hypothetical protein
VMWNKTRWILTTVKTACYYTNWREWIISIFSFFYCQLPIIDRSSIVKAAAAVA